MYRLTGQNAPREGFRDLIRDRVSVEANMHQSSRSHYTAIDGIVGFPVVDCFEGLLVADGLRVRCLGGDGLAVGFLEGLSVTGDFDGRTVGTDLRTGLCEGLGVVSVYDSFVRKFVGSKVVGSKVGCKENVEFANFNSILAT